MFRALLHCSWGKARTFLMNFLVTGGAGFIGSHVCQRLLGAGHAVWALDDLNGFYDPALKRRNLAEIQSMRKPFVFVQGDVADRLGVERLFREVKFDQVIHLAARAGVRAESGGTGALSTRQRRRHGQHPGICAPPMA